MVSRIHSTVHLYQQTLSTAPILSLPTPPADLPSTHDPAEHITPVERIFVEATPSNLVELVRDKISTQADRLIAPYLGKWMKATGIVDDVSTTNYWGQIETKQNGKGYYFRFEFDPKWNGRLQILHKDQKIAVIGKIRNIGSYTIYLTECEFAIANDWFFTMFPGRASLSQRPPFSLTPMRHLPRMAGEVRSEATRRGQDEPAAPPPCFAWPPSPASRRRSHGGSGFGMSRSSITTERMGGCPSPARARWPDPRRIRARC